MASVQSALIESDGGLENEGARLTFRWDEHGWKRAIFPSKSFKTDTVVYEQ